ncbi:hypothetical protein AWC18_15995 [Mycolicibacter nonchromogenicus]|uniref:Uncharacterized protein n=1 Tax=Mycolicibacter nonchromogenicus TaxID=1782 RepID=A0A1X1Z4L9_MYCNO|nr:hypothetical protein AWC18_15995 [Mycolicibacter nonchromogenicus]
MDTAERAIHLDDLFLCFGWHRGEFGSWGFVVLRVAQSAQEVPKAFLLCAHPVPPRCADLVSGADIPYGT